MNAPLALFAQIRKVDEEKRLVFGRIAEEAVDHSGEIMDYASSKPHFQKWSEDMAKATDGKNLGNVRAMHGKVAAGGLTGIEFNDGAKVVDVCAKIVDDNEWKKVLAGVYTGFSIGGDYVGEKKVEKVAGQDVKRYTARPNEASLVDRPCMKGARFFEVQKVDGSLAKVAFAEPEIEPIDVQGTDEQVVAFGKLLNDHGLTMGDVLEKAMPAFLAAAAKEKEDAAAKPGDKPAAETDEEKKAREAKEAAEKAAPSGDLAKLQSEVAELTKRLAGLSPAVVAPDSDLTKALAAAVAPLQKMLDDQAEQLKKIAAQPATPLMRLRAVSKTDEMTGQEEAKVAKILADTAPIVDSAGQKHEAAGLIKFLHTSGGHTMTAPSSLSK